MRLHNQGEFLKKKMGLGNETSGKKNTENAKKKEANSPSLLHDRGK